MSETQEKAVENCQKHVSALANEPDGEGSCSCNVCLMEKVEAAFTRLDLAESRFDAYKKLMESIDSEIMEDKCQT